MDTDPADLLSKHRYLMEIDFEALGEGPAAARQNWIGAMESAGKAAEHVRSGRLFWGNPGSFSLSEDFISTPRPSSNGSIVYRRQRHTGT